MPGLSRLQQSSSTGQQIVSRGAKIESGDRKEEREREREGKEEDDVQGYKET
jgi:hypothetical protein